ncbi:MAG: ATP-binding protein [Pseudomonadota bacterium]
MTAKGSAPFDEQLLLAQLKLVSAKGRLAILSNVVNAGLLVYLSRQALVPVIAAGWIGYLLATILVRFLIFWRFNRAPAQLPATGWARLFIVGALLTGLGWAAVAWAIASIGDIAQVAIVAFFVSGLTAGSLTLGGAFRPMALAFSAPPLLALSLALVLRDDEVSRLLAFVVLLYAIVVYSVLAFISSALVQSLRYGKENERLAASLEDALARAEIARAAQTRLVANVSHEIRTPMNAVMGMIDLARANACQHEREKYLGVARASAGALLHMLNDLLELSCLDIGKTRFKSESVNPLRLVSEVAELFRPAAARAGLGLSVENAWPQELAMLGDGDRIRQILVNLVGNAVKFTEQGSIVLHVRLAARDGDDQAMEIAVADTGIGIAEADLERVFQRFQKADAGPGRRHQGTGLGLAIARELARAMGGDLTGESTPDKGSTFTLRLPCAMAPAPWRASGATKDEKIPSAPPGLGAKARVLRALVVDDVETNCLLLASLLEQAGIGVEIARDGAQALARLAQHEAPAIDIVLMDIQMPVMDGLEATRKIRAGGARDKAVPIIAVTANAFKEQREACAAAGMQGFVTKPVDSQALLAEIQRVTSPSAPA